MKFLYKKELYAQRLTPQFNFPSIHLHGTQDTFKNDLTVNTLFDTASNPIVVEYDAGHRFPRQLSDEGFAMLKSFVRD